jgi:glycosyltransferase involved in cell wall biosynthesis
LNVTLACDAMMDLEGGVRPAMYLAHELVKRGHDVSMVSPIMSQEIEQYLCSTGVTPLNLHVNLFAKRLGFSLSWFELWGREAFFRLNSKPVVGRSSVRINFSHTLMFPSNFWYVQGPTSVALEEGEKEFFGVHKWGYKILKPLINYADGKLIKDTAERTAFVVANSNYCASIYQNRGIKVEEVIYPPVDCKIFQPQTSSPSSDYVLTYFGKETKFSVVKAVADLGVSIKAFGAKSPFIPKALTKHPNVTFLGRVSTGELVDLYSNALFTLFPFTHEPFGYVPVESMACGTPPLTYNRQGPSESVVHGYSGWLARSDKDFIHSALRFWKQGYVSQIRSNCVKVASTFDRTIYVEKWVEAIKPEEDK